VLTVLSGKNLPKLKWIGGELLPLKQVSKSRATYVTGVGTAKLMNLPLERLARPGRRFAGRIAFTDDNLVANRRDTI
jgi:hypothetical protein